NIILLVGVVCLAAIIVDPGFSAIDNAIGGASNYFSRGQSSNQLQEVSGRGEMWRAVYGEFEKSPMIGCGYFVTSEKGRIFVWGIHANHDAHHLILQAMVSTGLIGAGLLVISILRSAVSLVSVLRTSFPLIDGCGDPRRFLLIIPIWFLGWTQGCTSFLGPIRPESVVFAVVLGLLTGIHVRARRAATVSTPLANTVAGEEIAR
ncbi:MAG: O-antigen ligase family protein, partial [Planctomycetota bacterium]